MGPFFFPWYTWRKRESCSSCLASSCCLIQVNVDPLYFCIRRSTKWQIFFILFSFVNSQTTILNHIQTESNRVSLGRCNGLRGLDHSRYWKKNAIINIKEKPKIPCHKLYHPKIGSQLSQLNVSYCLSWTCFYSVRLKGKIFNSYDSKLRILHRWKKYPRTGPFCHLFGLAH